MAIDNLVTSVDRDKFSLFIPTAGVWNYVPNQINGQYTVTCVSTTVATIMIPPTDPTSSSITYSTSSGTVTFTVGQKTSFFIKTDTGSNIAVLFTRNAFASSTSTGTLDTITSSGIYTGTAASAFVFMVGGGNGGGGGGYGGPFPGSYPFGWTSGAGGGGGGAGGKSAFLYYGALPGSIPVTIGSGGPAGNAGGNTIFGSYPTAPYSGGPGGSGGAPGSFNASGGSGGSGAGSPIATFVNSLSVGISLPTTGGGGGGGGIAGAGGAGGGLASGGGGGGGGGGRSNPTLRGGGGGGGGGGGYVSGTPGTGGATSTSPAGAPGGPGGPGGDGGIYVVRYLG